MGNRTGNTTVQNVVSIMIVVFSHHSLNHVRYKRDFPGVIPLRAKKWKRQNQQVNKAEQGGLSAGLQAGIFHRILEINRKYATPKMKKTHKDG